MALITTKKRKEPSDAGASRSQMLHVIMPHLSGASSKALEEAIATKNKSKFVDIWTTIGADIAQDWTDEDGKDNAEDSSKVTSMVSPALSKLQSFNEEIKDDTSIVARSEMEDRAEKLKARIKEIETQVIPNINHNIKTRQEQIAKAAAEETKSSLRKKIEELKKTLDDKKKQLNDLKEQLRNVKGTTFHQEYDAGRKGKDVKSFADIPFKSVQKFMAMATIFEVTTALLEYEVVTLCNAIDTLFNEDE